MFENPEIENLSEDEKRIVEEVERTCKLGIVNYLEQLADTMEANKIMAVTATDLRGMALAMKNTLSPEVKLT